MKIIFIVTGIFFSMFSSCFAQKPVIDTTAINNWYSAGGGILNSTGKYFAYRISGNGLNVQVIEKINPVQKIAEVNDASSFSFTANKDLALFIKGKDSLVFFHLKDAKTEYVAAVGNYQLSPGRQWVTYQDNRDKKLYLQNLINHTSQSFNDVSSCRFSPGSKMLLIQTINPDSSEELRWLDLKSGKLSKAGEGKNISNLVFLGDNKLAFTTGNQAKTVWYADFLSGQPAISVFRNNSPGIDSGLKISSLQKFSEDGNRIFMALVEKTKPEPPQKNMAKVDIWSYTDVMLQSEQLQKIQQTKESRTYLALGDIGSKKVRRIQNQNEEVSDLDNGQEGFGVKTCSKTDISSGEIYWNQMDERTKYLISTQDGHQQAEIKGYPYSVSPDGCFLVYLDKGRHNCYSYDLISGNVIELSANLPIPKIDTSYDYTPGPKPGELRGDPIKWSADGTGFFLFDKYDIWLLDPSGKKSAVCITNGYGRRNHTTFNFAVDYDKVPATGKLLLTALNDSTQDEGFYSTISDKYAEPELLSMGAYRNNIGIFTFKPGDRPLNDGKAYIVYRESTISSQNYYLTTEFRKFTALTNIHPENDYNWLTSTLVNWRSLNGYKLQGVIYKPENFDPTKKYPVIITYYEKKSQEVNLFHEPYWMIDNINIPWFVSRGYIVVTPDIHYEMGHAGESALSAVLSLTKYLKTLSYINPDKIGIMGHSWGGFETNYIIAHSNIFAAAMAASGFSDVISKYGATMPNGGGSLQFFEDIDQTRIGSSLWDRPDLYIENSPVLNADKVTTPLLMMNNHQDGIVPFVQGVEFFTALRRLGKKVWMLQYDGEAHSLDHDKRAKLDYTIRTQQFFDHYLKDFPAPIWMTRGIPASEKGTTDGLEYDQNTRTPPPSPLIEPGKDPKLIYNYNND